MDQKIAIIDLGSNSVRMNLMAINERGGYGIHDSAKEMVRLSEGLEKDNMLKPRPMERTIKAMAYFKKLIEINEVEEIHVLCTAAVRQADNREVFIERVKAQVGLDLRVLSGEEEAYYDYLGVINAMDLEDALIIDIGGASTEIIWVKDRRLEKSVSLPYGSVNLTDRFASIKDQERRYRQAELFMKKTIKGLDWIKKTKKLPIIGLGGSIRALGKVDRNRNGFPIRNLHNYRMTAREVQEIFEMIGQKNEKDLSQIEGINSKRADVIALGLMPLKALLSIVKSSEMRISGNGLRDGYFYKTYFERRQWPLVVEDVLEHSIMNLINRFGVQKEHAHQVKNIALSLFDQTRTIHDFGESHRRVLKVASLVHDIGMHIDYYDHHIHGMYLLLYGKIHGLSNFEQIAVAYLVGNHRRDEIKNPLEEYRGIFTPVDREIYAKLGIFLKMAEQLDRSLSSNVKNIEVEIKKDVALLHLYGEEYPELDILSALYYAPLFKKQFNMELEILYAGA
ncbi:MAG: hypothetical protein AVO33_09350 [delta proteobacterium ML8_F1]|nr:MAG: hypothetical protein AVO33_09350 [delta proteobacterium ML8_F1]